MSDGTKRTRDEFDDSENEEDMFTAEPEKEQPKEWWTDNTLIPLSKVFQYQDRSNWKNIIKKMARTPDLKCSVKQLFDLTQTTSHDSVKEKLINDTGIRLAKSSLITFGVHEGKTVKEVFEDGAYQWMKWATENLDDKYPELVEEIATYKNHFTKKKNKKQYK